MEELCRCPGTVTGEVWKVEEGSVWIHMTDKDLLMVMLGGEGFLKLRLFIRLL